MLRITIVALGFVKSCFVAFTRSDQGGGLVWFCICHSLSIWHLAFGIWHSAFGIWHLTFGIWHLAFGIRHSAFGIWHSAFGTTHLDVSRQPGFGFNACLLHAILQPNAHHKHMTDCALVKDFCQRGHGLSIGTFCLEKRVEVVAVGVAAHGDNKVTIVNLERHVCV